MLVICFAFLAALQSCAACNISQAEKEGLIYFAKVLPQSPPRRLSFSVLSRGVERFECDQQGVWNWVSKTTSGMHAGYAIQFGKLQGPHGDVPYFHTSTHGSLFAGEILVNV